MATWGSPYSQSGTRALNKKKSGLEAHAERVYLATFASTFVLERASRCYELGSLALDACRKCFEQRDALGSSDEFSEVVWS